MSVCRERRSSLARSPLGPWQSYPQLSAINATNAIELRGRRDWPGHQRENAQFDSFASSRSGPAIARLLHDRSIVELNTTSKLHRYWCAILGLNQ